MAKLVLHELSGTKRAGELASLVEKLFLARRRMVVWVADEGRRQILDEWLWTFRKLAFVPHSLWDASLGEVDEPIVLVGEPANPNHSAVLVVGDDLPPGEWSASFEEVHDLVPPGADGEARRRHWREWAQEHGASD